MGLVTKLSSWVRGKSPWLYHMYSGTCNGCDLEIVTALTPLYDAERFGCILSGTPRHADVVLVTGCMVKKCRDRFIQVYEQVPEPHVTVAIGNCAISGGMFKDSYAVGKTVDQTVKVDVYVPGCPPRPESILKAVKKAAGLLK